MDEFLLQISTYLETKGVKTDFEKLKKEINADPLMAKLGVDSTASKQQVRELATEIHSALDGIFKNAGVNDFKISIKDVEGIINGSLKQAQKEEINRQKQITKEVQETQKAQELHNQKIKEGKELASKQANDTSLSKQKSLYDEIANNQKQVYLLKQKLISSDTLETQELNSQIGILEKRNQYLNYKVGKSGLSSDSYETQLAESKKLYENQLKLSQAKAADKSISSINKQDTKEIQNQIAQVQKLKKLQSSGSIDSSVSDSELKYSKLSNTTAELDANFKQLKIDQQALGASTTDEELIANYEKFSTTLTKVNSQMKVLGNEQNSALNSSKLSSNFEKLQYSLESFLNSNPKAVKNMGNEFDDLKVKIANAAKSADATQYKNLSSEFGTLKKKAEAFGNVGETMFSKLGKNAKQFLNYLGSATIIMTAINSIRTVVKNVTDVNTAMTELYKVTDNTKGEYASFFKDATVSAQKYGAKLTDIINSTADWARLGYSLQDSKGLANIATMYKNVGDIDISTATSDLVTALKGFSGELDGAFDTSTEKAEHVADVYNELGNNYAITSAQIGTGISNAASALSTANNTLEQSAAMVTAVTEVTQNASEAGNALKVLSMRLRGAASDDLQSIGEDTDGLITSSSLLRENIKAISGVDIMVDDNTFKSTYQIMQEISKVYDKLSDTSKANLLQIIAGKQRGNQAAALLSNFDTAENALSSALDSTNSAEKENEKYLNSIQGKINQFEASIQSLSTTLLSSGIVKFFVDLGTGAANSLNYIVSTLGSIPSLLLAIGTAAGTIKGVGKLKNALGMESKKDVMKDIRDAVTNTSENGETAQNTAENVANKEATDVNSASQTKNATTRAEKSATIQAENVELEKNTFLSEEQSVTKEAESLATSKNTETVLAENAAKKESLTISEKLSKVKAGVQSFFSVGYLLSIAGVLASIYGLFKANESVSKSLGTQGTNDKNESKLVERDDSYDSLISQINEYQSQIDSTNDKLTTLQKKKTDGTITDSENAELTLMLSQNDALKDSIKLLEKKKQSQASSVVNALTNDVDTKYSNNDTTGSDNKGAVYSYDAKDLSSPQLLDSILQANEDIKASQNALADGEVDVNEATSDIEAINDKKSEWMSALSENSADISGDLDNKQAQLEAWINSSEVTDDEKARLQTSLGYILEYKKKLNEILNGDLISNVSDKLSSVGMDSDAAKGFAESLSTSELNFVASLTVDKDSVLNAVNNAVSEGQTDADGNPIEAKTEIDDDDIIQYVKDAISDAQSEADGDPVKVKGEIEFSEGNLNDLLTIATDHAKAIASVKNEIEKTGNISVDSMKEIISIYPQMSDALTKYKMGQMSEQEVFSMLTECYNTDYNNYIGALESKAGSSEEFWTNILSNNSNLVDQLSALYGTDWKNWTTLDDTKLKAEKSLIQQLSQIWSEYYRIVAKNAEGQLSVISQSDLYSDASEYDESSSNFAGSDYAMSESMYLPNNDKMNQIQNLIDQYNNLADSIDSASYDAVTANFNPTWEKAGGYEPYDGENSGSDSGSDDKTEDAKEYSAELDYIDRQLKRIQQDQDLIDSKAKSIYETFSDRNASLEDEYASVIYQMAEQAADLQEYQAQMDAIDLSDDYKESIQNGGSLIATITDEDENDKVEEYEKWYDKSQDLVKSQAELKVKLADLRKERFDNIVKQFEQIGDSIAHTSNMLQKYIDMSEKTGVFADTNLYTGLIKAKQDELANLFEEKSRLEAESKNVFDGGAEYGSEAWNDMKNQIDSVTEAILDAQVSIADFNKSLRELDYSKFEYMEDAIKNVTSESQFYIDLISKSGKKLYDSETGQYTDEGMATVGLHSQNYSVLLQQATDYSNKIKDINAQLANDPNNKDILAKKQEYIEAQRESVLAAYDERDAIKELVEGQYQARIDALNDLIEAREKLIDKEKDEYDYQKSIAEKVANLAKLQKQQNSLMGDDSEENKKTVQELKESIKESKADLEETEYEKRLNDEKEILENLKDELEAANNERADNIDSELKDVSDMVNQNADTISSTLERLSGETNLQLSSAIKDIWSGDTPVSSINSTVSNINAVLTNTNIAIEGLRNDIRGMYNSQNAETEATISSNNSDVGDYIGSSDSSYDDSSSSSDDSSDSGSGDVWEGLWNSLTDDQADHNSIVDMLKLNNFDSSWEARGRYYDELGGDGEYYGGDAQNEWLLQKLHESGYAKGSKNILNDEISWTHDGEIIRKSDGGLLRQLDGGTTVFPKLASDNLYDFGMNPSSYMSNLKTSNVTSVNKNVSPSISVNVEKIVTPNPTDFTEQLVNSVSSNKNVQNLLVDATISRMQGKSVKELAKYR